MYISWIIFNGLCGLEKKYNRELFGLSEDPRISEDGAPLMSEDTFSNQDATPLLSEGSPKSEE